MTSVSLAGVRWGWYRARTALIPGSNVKVQDMIPCTLQKGEGGRISIALQHGGENCPAEVGRNVAQPRSPDLVPRMGVSCSFQAF